MIYSYHIFYFPFKWEIMGLENQAFSDQVNLDNIQYNRNSHWERSQKPDPGEEGHYITRRTIIIHLYTIYYMMKSTVH